MGFWKALRQVYPATREQRCWVHKTANVLDKMHKRVQPKAKEMVHAIWMAPTRAAAEQAFDAFVEMFGPKYPGAVECLKKDRDVLLTFYDFPAEHWVALAHDEPDRIDVRDGASAASPDEGQRHACGVSDDGVQVGGKRGPQMADAKRRQTAAGRHRRRPLRIDGEKPERTAA